MPASPPLGENPSAQLTNNLWKDRRAEERGVQGLKLSVQRQKETTGSSWHNSNGWPFISGDVFHWQAQTGEQTRDNIILRANRHTWSTPFASSQSDRERESERECGAVQRFIYFSLGNFCGHLIGFDQGYRLNVKIVAVDALLASLSSKGIRWRRERGCKSLRFGQSGPSTLMAAGGRAAARVFALRE